MSREVQITFTSALIGALLGSGFFIPGTAGTLVMTAAMLLAAFNLGRIIESRHTDTTEVFICTDPDDDHSRAYEAAVAAREAKRND